jgi:hypothetical protein
VNSKDVDRVILGETVASRLPPQIQAHVRDCNRCQELIRSFNAFASPDSPLPASLRQIERNMVADLRPVRALLPARYIFAAFIAIFVSLDSFAVYRMGALESAVMSPFNGQHGSRFAGNLRRVVGLLLGSSDGSRRPAPNSSKTAAGWHPSLADYRDWSLFQFQYEPKFWSNGWACIRAGIPIGVLARCPTGWCCAGALFFFRV